MFKTTARVIAIATLAAACYVLAAAARGDDYVGRCDGQTCTRSAVLADSPGLVQPVLFGRRLQTFQHGYHLGRNSCFSGAARQAAAPIIASHGGHHQYHHPQGGPQPGTFIQPRAVPYSTPPGCQTDRWTQAGPRLIHFHGDPARAPRRVWHQGQYWIRDAKPGMDANTRFCNSFN